LALLLLLLCCLCCVLFKKCKRTGGSSKSTESSRTHTSEDKERMDAFSGSQIAPPIPPPPAMHDQTEVVGPGPAYPGVMGGTQPPPPMAQNGLPASQPGSIYNMSPETRY
jgi:hypothetical protein